MYIYFITKINAYCIIYMNQKYGGDFNPVSLVPVINIDIEVRELIDDLIVNGVHRYRNNMSDLLDT